MLQPWINCHQKSSFVDIHQAVVRGRESPYAAIAIADRQVRLRCTFSLVQHVYVQHGPFRKGVSVKRHIIESTPQWLCELSDIKVGVCLHGSPPIEIQQRLSYSTFHMRRCFILIKIWWRSSRSNWRERVTRRLLVRESWLAKKLRCLFSRL